MTYQHDLKENIMKVILDLMGNEGLFTAPYENITLLSNSTTLK